MGEYLHEQSGTFQANAAETVLTIFREKSKSPIFSPVNKIVRGRVDVLRLNHPFKNISTFIIKYENTISKDFYRSDAPSANEIEAFCSGVDAEREQFQNILASVCDEETLQEILRYQSHLLKRSEIDGRFNQRY